MRMLGWLNTKYNVSHLCCEFYTSDLRMLIIDLKYGCELPGLLWPGSDQCLQAPSPCPAWSRLPDCLSKNENLEMSLSATVRLYCSSDIKNLLGQFHIGNSRTTDTGKLLFFCQLYKLYWHEWTLHLAFRYRLTLFH